MIRSKCPAGGRTIEPRTETPPQTSGRLWRIRSILQLLVLACVIPGIAGTTFLFVREYLNGREQLNTNLIATARAMQQSVDSQIFNARSAAQTLSTFGGLSHADLQGFHAWARRVIEQSGTGLNVVLSDRNGQQVLNTLSDFGEALPTHGNLEVLQSVFSKGETVISPIYTDGLLNRPVLSIDVPVIRDDEIIYDLSLGILPSDFNTVLSNQNFPADWVAIIFDNTGTIAARTHSPDIFVGQKGAPDYIRSISLAQEGAIQTVTLEGVPTASVWSRSAATDWSVGIGIPREILEKDLQAGMFWLASGLSALLLASLVLAWFVGRQIAVSVQALKLPALAMGKGLVEPETPVLIEEVAEVAGAIRQAARLLERHQADLVQVQSTNLQDLERRVEERTRELVRANTRLEQLALTDMLTGLHNRNSANGRLRREFLRFKRSGSCYALLFLDLDHFKQVNDTYGHETGDQVLRLLAKVLMGAIRESDYVARYGGEEFLVLLPDTNLDGALVLAERIRVNVMEQALPLVNHVTVSIGVAVVHAEDENEDASVRRADEAMYQAKTDGRNLVRGK